MKECRGVPRCPATTVQSVGTVTVCRRIRRVNPAQELQASRVKEVGTERKEHVMERPAPPESQSIFIGVQGRFDAESWMQCFGTPMKTPHDKRVLLEVCIASVGDAQSAQAAGADRVELNAALALGGLTPSLGTLMEVKRTVNLPVIVMIRPRSGGFAYSAADFLVMQRDIDLALEHGADGIAFGILTDDGEIDVDCCRKIVQQAERSEVVFHRAFDVTPEPLGALEQLVDLGVKRLMTSGQEESAYNGVTLIAKLMKRAAGRIEILPAGGINRFTVGDVLARTGCDQVHASLRTRRPDSSVSARPHVTFGSTPKTMEDRYDATDALAVAELAALLK